MLNKKTIRDVDVNGKKVLVRVDFNVPLDKKDTSVITSDKRIVAALDTINYLIENKAIVILCSHIGKHSENLTLAPVAKRLSELLDKNVTFVKDVIGADVKNAVNSASLGDCILLENVRKYSEEEANDDSFSKELASIADIYVNDAFGTAHRAHASTVGVTKYLPAYAGFLVEKELNALDKGINDPKRPLLAIIGGAKVSSKLPVLLELLNKVDSLVIAGAMVYTFIKANGGNIGSSIYEEEMIENAKEIMQKAKEKGVKLVLAKDAFAAAIFEDTKDKILVDADKIPDGYIGLDIGVKTLEIIKEQIDNAKTIVWNGPVGAFEFTNFSIGTYEVARYIASSSAISIVGGGDTALAVENAGVEKKMTHVSTGGGASLEFMEGKELPGVAALLDK